MKEQTERLSACQRDDRFQRATEEATAHLLELFDAMNLSDQDEATAERLSFTVMRFAEEEYRRILAKGVKVSPLCVIAAFAHSVAAAEIWASQFEKRDDHLHE